MKQHIELALGWPWPHRGAAGRRCLAANQPPYPATRMRKLKIDWTNSGGRKKSCWCDACAADRDKRDDGNSATCGRRSHKPGPTQ